MDLPLFRLSHPVENYDFVVDFKDFISPSMGRYATPTDNPVSERFMGTFKRHKINNKTLQQYLFDELMSGKKINSYTPMVQKYITSINESSNKKSFNKAPYKHDADVTLASMFMKEPKHPKAFSPTIMDDPRMPSIQEYKGKGRKITSDLERIAAEDSEVVNETPFDDNYEANLQFKLMKRAFKEIKTKLQNNPKEVRTQVEQLLDPLEESINEQFDEVQCKLDKLLPKPRRKKEVLPLRDPLKGEIFPLFVVNAGKSFQYQKDLRRSQLRVTYTILFHVGLRINEIRQLNEDDILTAVKSGQFNIIHTKTQKATIHVLSKRGVNDLKNCQLDLEIIFSKYRYKYLFGKNKPVADKVLIRMVNKDLKHTCDIEDIPFNIKSHSFRINMITNLLKVTTVQHTAEIIGHSDIRSTIYISDTKNFSGDDLNLIF